MERLKLLFTSFCRFTNVAMYFSGAVPSNVIALILSKLEVLSSVVYNSSERDKLRLVGVNERHPSLLCGQKMDEQLNNW